MKFHEALAGRDQDVREEGHLERISGDEINPLTLGKNKLRPRVEKSVGQSCHAFDGIIHTENTMCCLLNFNAVSFILSYLLKIMESKSYKGLI